MEEAVAFLYCFCHGAKGPQIESAWRQEAKLQKIEFWIQANIYNHHYRLYLETRSHWIQAGIDSRIFLN